MSNQLSSRLGRFTFNSGKKNNNNSPPPNPGQPSGPPMNQPGVPRPSSYPPPYAPPPQHLAGRATSPMPPPGPYGPGQIGPIPPQGQPPMGMQGPPPQPYGHPPVYPTGAPPQMGHRDSHPGMHQMQNRPQAAEVEGTNKSKAQLIVGIDFVSIPKHNYFIYRSGKYPLRLI